MALANSYYKPDGFFADEQWKVSFSLAVVLHILVLLLTLLPSSFFRSKVEMPEVVTINLFNVEELKTPKAKPMVRKPLRKVVRKIQPKPFSKPQPPPPPPKAVSIVQQPTPPAPVPALSAKVISLRPRIMKKKVVAKKKPKNRDLDAKLLNAVARIRAQKKQKVAQEKARDALARLRDQLHIVPSIPVAPEVQAESSAISETADNSNNSAVLMDKALNRYYLAVSRKIHEHWVLPEMQKWDDSLESIFIVKVNRNGVIAKKSFEKRSGNSFFDQFVEKTIQEAAPMPHFPADIKESSLELGFVFHPSGLL